MKKRNNILIFVLLLVLSCFLVSARTHTGPPDDTVDFLIDGWDRLPFKDQRYNESWVKL